MNAASLCSEMKAGLGPLFECSQHGKFERVRTPYLYPDGDHVDLFLRQEGDHIVVSDLGETTRWLRSQTVSLRRSPKQRSLIADICLTHGVEFFRGVLVARCRPDEPIAPVVMRVAQVAMRVSDLWFTFRTRAVESLTDEIADLLTERNITFQRGEKLSGRSGRVWPVDFHARTPSRSSLVYVLSTGNRSAARSVTEHVLAAWYDLNHLAAGPEALRFVSLFDDTADVWSTEDFRLVESISTVSRWSRPDEFVEQLTDAV